MKGHFLENMVKLQKEMYCRSSEGTYWLHLLCVLTSVCHKLEMKAVPSLDRSSLEFPLKQCLARKQWNRNSIEWSVVQALPTGFWQAVFHFVDHCPPNISYHFTYRPWYDELMWGTNFIACASLSLNLCHLPYNGPFDSFTTTALKSPWRWHVWRVETCCRTTLLLSYIIIYFYCIM